MNAWWTLEPPHPYLQSSLSKVQWYQGLGKYLWGGGSNSCEIYQRHESRNWSLLPKPFVYCLSSISIILDGQKLAVQTQNHHARHPSKTCPLPSYTSSYKRESAVS